MCDVFIVPSIFFSLVFTRVRNDYISSSVNIRTNKLERDLQDTHESVIFSLRVPSRRRHVAFRYSSSSHIASSKKAFVELLKIRADVVKYTHKLTYTLEFNDVHAPQFLLHLNFTTIISSHPSFQISSEQFLISIVSKSTLHFWTGIDW